MTRGRPSSVTGEGLAALRRSGSVTELLFLYECITLEPIHLKPVAERLGLTVQAASHCYRSLRRRGLVHRHEGHYRATVEGVAWLHGSLGRLAEDVRGRVDRLHVIRSTRAVAATPLPEGAMVSLEMERGLLTARAGGRGPSRGRVRRSAQAGDLVEVTDLEGIVPIPVASVKIRTLTDRDLGDPGLARRIRSVVEDAPGILAAEGLEAFHVVRRSTERPVARFAVAASVLAAAGIGVPSLILVHERDLPRLLASFAVANPPPLEVAPLPSGHHSRRGLPLRHRDPRA